MLQLVVSIAKNKKKEKKVGKVEKKNLVVII